MGSNNTKEIIVGISSGIAGYKVVNLIKALNNKGINTIPMLTQNALKMFSRSMFEEASGNKVSTELFPKDFDYKSILQKRSIEHISLADKAKLICVAPATANIIAKIASGICDDILTTTILASNAPLIICPSMNVNMWNKKITQNNIQKLIDFGAIIVPPDEGRLACGYEGTGRLPNINIIEEEILKQLEKGKLFSGINVLITAGGTEEDIDAVRVITNKSSGKMGFAIAEEFYKRGADVTIIKARTSVNIHCKARIIEANSFSEISKAIMHEVPRNDVLIHAAAISDFYLESPSNEKLNSETALEIKLRLNKKIITEIKSINKRIFLVGFKALSNASKEKIYSSISSLFESSNSDLILMNDVSKNTVFGSDLNEVSIFDKDGSEVHIPLSKKSFIAERLVDEVALRIKNKT